MFAEAVRIGRDFAYAGIQIDPEKNDPSPPSLGTTIVGTEISYDDAPVRVVVIPSDEERMIARDTVRLIIGEDAA